MKKYKLKNTAKWVLQLLPRVFTFSKIVLMKYCLLIFSLLFLYTTRAQDPRLVLPLGHTDKIIDYKITPDEKFLITASEDRTAKIWNYRTGKFMYDLKLHTNSLTGIDMSKDGNFVVLGSADGTYSKWDITTGKLLYHSSRKAAIRKLFLLPGDSTVLLIKDYVLVIGGLKTKIEDILFGEIYENYNDDKKKEIAISPDFTTLAVYQKKHPIQIYNLPDGTYIRSFNRVSIDSIRYYDLARQTPDFLYFTTNNELSVSFNGNSMAGINIGGQQTFFYPETVGKGYKLNRNRTLMAFKNGRDGIIRIWNTQLKKVTATIPDKTKFVIIKFSDLTSNLILCNGKTVQEWSVEGVLIRERQLEEREFSPLYNYFEEKIIPTVLNINSAETIAIAEMKNGLQTINWKTGKIINEFMGKIDEVKKVAASKTGKWLFEIKKEYSNYWNLHTMNVVRFPEYENEVVQDILQTDTDDKVLLQYKNTFCLFDCTTEKIIYTKAIKWRDKILMLKGNTSFISIDESQIKKYSVANGTLINEWKIPDNINYATATYTVSDNDSLLAYNTSVSNNDSIIIWDLVNNKKVVSFYKPGQYVERDYFVVYTPNYEPMFHFSNDNKYIFFSSGEIGKLSTAKLPYEEYLKDEWYDNTIDSTYSITDTIHYDIDIVYAQDGFLGEFFSKYYPITVIEKQKIVLSSTDNETGDDEIKATNYETGKTEFKLSYPQFQRIIFYDSIKNLLYTATTTEWLLWDITKKKLIKKWQLPEGMKAVSVVPQSNQLFISSNDRIGIQFLDTKKPVYFFSTLTQNESIAYRNDKFYKVTPNAVVTLSWNIQERFYDFDQWDIQYNRPDKMLEITNSEDKELATAYYKAYLKRLKKNGLTEKSFNQTTKSPQIVITNEITNGDIVTDSVFLLKLKIVPIINESVTKIFILVNGCPLFGKQGFETLLTKETVVEFPIKMSLDLNSIKVSCTDNSGNESVREQLQVIYHSAFPLLKKNHFIGIGINQFSNTDYNLSWSVKDIRDLALKLKSKYPNIIIDTLFDNNVTKENILALKQKLLQLSEDDKVIVSYSGHGVLSKDFDYFLSTYNIDFSKPEQNGLAYDDLENLLDSIKPRKKLLLIDACHSGEVDKEELSKIETSKSQLKNNGVVANKSTIKIVKKDKQLGMLNSFELMQNLFVNVSKGTGATIISAAGGTQYAQERGDLKNGVFTFSIIDAFNNHKTLKVSELKKIVGEKVIQLTNGLQKPTSRNETNNYDWIVW